jgi:hypothetical protein
MPTGAFPVVPVDPADSTATVPVGPPEYAGRPPATPTLFAEPGDTETTTEPIAVPVAVPVDPAVPDPVVPASVPPQPQPLPVAPQPVQLPVVTGPGQTRRSRPVLIAAILAVVAVVLVGIGVGMGRISAATTGAGQRPGQSTVNPAPTAGTPTTPVPTEPTSPAPTTPAGRPITPDQALTLTDQQAVTELNLEGTESAPQLATLAGSWVPQVSSKCVGVRVDIQPSWVPDGVDDTEHVTIQQVLAFHLSLHGRFGALTVHPTQVGVTSDRATAGPCAGQDIWTSIVPQSFGSAADANAWCAVNVAPVRECAARYVARPGERSTLVLRQ